MVNKVLTLLLFYVFVGYVRGSSLIIYASKTLVENPLYNFTMAFEQYAGLPAGSVLLYELPEVFVIVNSTIFPDVIIGFDNINQYLLDKNTFLPVESSLTQLVDPHLYSQVSSLNLLPFEQGRITILGNKTRIGNKFDPSTLTLQSLAANPDILRTLIVQDPFFSEVGSAFLLSTIAAFGDPKVGLVGTIPGSDWQSWWNTVLTYSRYAPTWNISWETFQSNDAYTLMIGYEMEPNYYSCQGMDDIISLNLASELWYLVDSVGIHSKSKNITLAQQFVDWIMSPDIQTFIPLRNQMFPTRNNVSIPDCYKGVSPNPEFTPFLNASIITQNWYNWTLEWEKIYNKKYPVYTTSTSSAAFCFLSSFLAFVWFMFAF